MRLIVTGASGFVGRGLLPLLARHGHTGIATGRTTPRNLPTGWEGFRRQDLLAGTPIGSPIHAVIHLEVKQHAPNPSNRDIHEFETVNVAGTHDWLTWAAAHDVTRFVFTSSIKAVGAGTGAHTEADIRPPDTPYGRSKAQAESLVRSFVASSTARTATILRPAPVYGAGNEANLAAFVRQILRGQPCFVGDGSVRKSVVSRKNLAAAIEFVLTEDRLGCEVYNVSDAETVSLRELASLIADVARARRPRSIPKGAAIAVAAIGDVVEWLTNYKFPLTTARLRTLCEESFFPSDKLIAKGFRHAESLQTGIAELVAWTRSRIDHPH